MGNTGWTWLIKDPVGEILRPPGVVITEPVLWAWKSLCSSSREAESFLFPRMSWPGSQLSTEAVFTTARPQPPLLPGLKALWQLTAEMGALGGSPLLPQDGPSRPQTGRVRLSKPTHIRGSHRDKSLGFVCVDSKPLSRTSQYDRINLSTRASYGLADLCALFAVYQWAQSAHVSSSARAPSLTWWTRQAIILPDHKRPPCKRAESHRGHRSVQWFTRSLPDTF